MNRRRVVITGIGMVTPLGLDRETSFEGMLAGQNGIGPITTFDTTNFTTRIAGELKGFDPKTQLDPQEARRLDRFVHLSAVAADEAAKDCGLDFDEIDPTRAGSICGTGIGGLLEIEAQHIVLLERGPGRVKPFLIPKLMMNAMSAHISMKLGLKGPNWVTASACASAAHALGSALRSIQYGESDIMVAGGSEAAITALGVAGFCSMGAMSTRNDQPERASRPFDRDRDGFVMGEGAAILVLEDLEHAKKRGARIYCELAGFGATADAFHITAPAENAEGAQRSMRLAMAEAGFQPEDVTYINAHGTSTPINDPNETAAIKAVLGPAARKVMISSTKSMIGHLLGASAAVEAAVCALSIARSVIHPTRNLENPDPACDLDYVPNGAREVKVDGVLSNSLGFGGHNATLAFRRYTG
jgi:3-oxoacyl-[acyl-carrier-protein] synthase II